MTRLARKYPSIPPFRGPAPCAGAGVRHGERGYSWSASWIENGVRTRSTSSAPPRRRRPAPRTRSSSSSPRSSSMWAATSPGPRETCHDRAAAPPPLRPCAPPAPPCSAALALADRDSRARARSPRSTRAAAADPFSYRPGRRAPSRLGRGARAGRRRVRPPMRFPLEEGPAFANSQVYSKGGSAGPAGGQCDADNYALSVARQLLRAALVGDASLPLRHRAPGAGRGAGDVRGGETLGRRGGDGTITSVGSYSVYLTGEDGTRYDYLHMSDVQVSPGQDVSRGERIGRCPTSSGARRRRFTCTSTCGSP